MQKMMFSSQIIFLTKPLGWMREHSRPRASQSRSSKAPEAWCPEQQRASRAGWRGLPSAEEGTSYTDITYETPAWHAESRDSKKGHGLGKCAY